MFCRSLRNKISEFLKGHSHPDMSPEGVEFFFGAKYEPRNRKIRSQRLIEVLKTIDGMFLQRYLSTLSEEWTWRKYDMFVLWNLYNLIDDEFYDGTLQNVPDVSTFSYAQLKTARKKFKEAAHKGQHHLKMLADTATAVPAWLLHIRHVWRDAARYKDKPYVYRIGMLCQTRGCGTPPPAVLIHSKMKFIIGCGIEPEPLSPTEKMLIKLSIDKVISELPDSSFTGLSTKSRVTVTSAASWEKTQKDGGTAEAIREIVSLGTAGIGAKTFDLDTGNCDGKVFLPDCTVGEYIFWKCLEKVLLMTDEERSNAFLVVIKEPGKARSITKASAYVKVVLDLVSKLCCEPLAKGIRSSSSGMGKANHGWELFQSYMSEETGIELFQLKTRKRFVNGDVTTYVDTYRDVFASSTDYSEATDHMHHEVARMLGVSWMRKCGIPILLRKLVASICYRPRKIFYRAAGVLKTVGHEHDEDIRFMILRKGILMGDPLTKPVLHLINVCTRVLGENITDANFLAKGFANPIEMANSFKQQFQVKT
jgi:hypothetical protein